MILPPLSSEPTSGPSLSFQLGINFSSGTPLSPTDTLLERSEGSKFFGEVGLFVMPGIGQMIHRYSLSERLAAVYVLTLFAVTALALVSCVSAFVFAIGNIFI